jgi:23S rRNA (guanosine2251-2'-O)-methyltransferase
MVQNKTYIYGKHAVSEALAHKPEIIKQVLFSESMDDASLRSLAKKKNVTVSVLNGHNMPAEADAANHQGAVAIISVDELVIPYKKFIESLPEHVSADTALVLLNEIQDPQNVGAVIRSAAAFGISAILIPEHNQAPVTGVVVKVSAGMAFRVPLVSINNENNVIRDLKKKGFWAYGLAGEGDHDLTTEIFDAPALFVLGNEGSGLREKTRELCDVLLSIPMAPKCESLNAATSMAVTMYAWSAQHPNAIR